MTAVRTVRTVDVALRAIYPSEGSHAIQAEATKVFEFLVLALVSRWSEPALEGLDSS